MKTRTALLTIAAALLLGCGRYFTPDINVQRYLKESDVMGTWTLTTNTMTLARRGGYAPAEDSAHEIVVASNGLCRFSSIVEFGTRSEYVEGDGRWKLIHDTEFRGDPKGRKNRLELTITAMNGTRVMSFDFTEEHNTIYLWASWGDPDSWEFMKYEKRG